MGTTFSNNPQIKRSYIAFFDLDNTLIRTNSSSLLIRTAYRNKMITIVDILKALWLSFLFRFNLRDTEKIIAGMVKWLTGISEISLHELAAEAVKTNMDEFIPDKARAEIKFHKDRNASVVILSSALHPVCSAISEILEMDDIICTELESFSGKYTGKPSGRLCFGQEKKTRLISYCERFNNKTSDAWFYSDSISDMPALTEVGHPVCINPDRKLKRKAREKKWAAYIW